MEIHINQIKYLIAKALFFSDLIKNIPEDIMDSEDVPMKEDISKELDYIIAYSGNLLLNETEQDKELLNSMKKVDFINYSNEFIINLEKDIVENENEIF